MSYDVYRYIFIGGLVLSLVMLAATVLLFFVLNIRTAFGDITGSNKRKAIEHIHNKSAADSHKKKAVKFDYESQTTSAKLAAESMETAKISPQDRYDSMGAAETTALSAPEVSETTVLSAAEVAEPPQPEVPEQQAPVLAYQAAADQTGEFYIETDITYVHSNEVIR